MSIPGSIHSALRELGVFPHDLILCAVSGGGDSVSLAAAVHASGYRRLHVAWINHNLRSTDETARDGRAVQELAHRLAVPMDREVIPPGEIESHAGSSGHGVEQVARRLRYEALLRIAVRIAAGHASQGGASTTVLPTVYLLTAHHRDDQSETVLSRIADGHPATVPVAIPRRRVLSAGPVPVILVRPALNLSGDSLRDWGARQGLRWADDSTNWDARYRRNALRHHVLPRLTEVLPASSRMLARYGSSHDRLLDALRALVPADCQGHFDNASWVVGRDAFLSLPDAAREFVLRDTAYKLSASIRVDSGFIGEVLRRLSIADGDASRIHVSGADLHCTVTATEIRVNRDIVPVSQRGYLWPVCVGRVVSLGSDGTRIFPSDTAEAPALEDTCVACASIVYPAVLRDHRSGDAMRWRGRKRTLSEVARRVGVPREFRKGAAVVESTAGIEAVFWRGRRFAVRDGGRSEQCVNSEPSAAIFRMQG
ncbi:MAG: tRNA lysidine(34) synthetase TilS [Alkalispirochaeta sp.]